MPRDQQDANLDRRPEITILVVDDEESFHDVVDRHLQDYRLLRAYNGWQTKASLHKYHIDVVLLDLNLPDIRGLELLGYIRTERQDIEVIVITAHSEIPNAVDAIKCGAFDFLAKTYENYQHLADHIERALLHRQRRREQIAARARMKWLGDAFSLLDRSQSVQMRKIVKLGRKVARTPLTVLLEGESGVGKEILAQYIHAHSDRADAPFVAVHLAAVPTALLESQLFGHVKGAFTDAHREQIGKFELANNGTLFLDEIGDLDSNAQVKLLRVLQEREVERIGAREPSPVNVRVIAATNKNLKKMVSDGEFREDLYFRLNVIRVRIPSLRDRKEDMPELIGLLTDKHAAIMSRRSPTFTDDALSVLRHYDWPGNVRELENLIMRLVALSPGLTLTADDIPPEYCLATLHRLAEKAACNVDDSPKDERIYFLARAQFERYLVRLMVNRHHGDKRAAAKALGVSLTTIKDKIRESGVDWNIEL